MLHLCAPGGRAGWGARNLVVAGNKHGSSQFQGFARSSCLGASTFAISTAMTSTAPDVIAANPQRIEFQMPAQLLSQPLSPRHQSQQIEYHRQRCNKCPANRNATEQEIQSFPMIFAILRILVVLVICFVVHT